MNVCERCGHDDLESTDEMEADTIYPEVCHLTFVCHNCGAIWSIEFQPVETTFVAQSERSHYNLDWASETS